MKLSFIIFITFLSCNVFAQWNNVDKDNLRKRLSDGFDENFIIDLESKNLLVNCNLNKIVIAFKVPNTVLKEQNDSIKTLLKKIHTSCIVENFQGISFKIRWGKVTPQMVLTVADKIDELKKLDIDKREKFFQRLLAELKKINPDGLPLKISKSQKTEISLVMRNFMTDLK